MGIAGKYQQGVEAALFKIAGYRDVKDLWLALKVVNPFVPARKTLKAFQSGKLSSQSVDDITTHLELLKANRDGHTKNLKEAINISKRWGEI